MGGGPCAREFLYVQREDSARFRFRAITTCIVGNAQPFCFFHRHPFWICARRGRILFSAAHSISTCTIRRIGRENRRKVYRTSIASERLFLPNRPMRQCMPYVPRVRRPSARRRHCAYHRTYSISIPESARRPTTIAISRKELHPIFLPHPYFAGWISYHLSTSVTRQGVDSPRFHFQDPLKEKGKAKLQQLGNLGIAH